MGPYNILYSDYLWAIIIASLGSQAIKVIIRIIRNRKIGWHDLVATGGIPSSHTALMSAITSILYLKQGSQPITYLSLAITLVVIVDAMGVRRTAGEEGEIIHKLIEKTGLKIKKPHFSLGHTPIQVTAGVIFGIITAALTHMI